ncbi:MAG TPA: GAF domain-containing protein [Terriglobales bacterium]|nr:GAF domain-containing protein [Terriglobales bacterium]HXY15388.1 GAF domain-containing protein [Terriglobales bacterium]
MAKRPDSSQDVSAAAAALAPDNSVEFVLGQADTAEKFCTALAKLFGVRAGEVALLRLEKGLLKFVLPEQLKTAGSIPVSSSSSIAAQTAASKKTHLFNAFTKVKHARVFETVRPANPTEDQSEQASIQKLMSVPVLSHDRKVLGVIQISRKAFDASSAGPDFTAEDLQQLELAAKVAANKPFMKQ